MIINLTQKIRFAIIESEKMLSRDFGPLLVRSCLVGDLGGQCEKSRVQGRDIDTEKYSTGL